MREHGALRNAGGTAGIKQHGDVFFGRARRRRGRARALHGAKGREVDEPHLERVGGRRAHAARGADHERHACIGKLLGDLPHARERVHRRHRAARVPGRIEADDEIDSVRQAAADAHAGSHPRRAQAGGGAAHGAPELLVRERTPFDERLVVELTDGDTVGEAGDAALEHPPRGHARIRERVRHVRGPDTVPRPQPHAHSTISSARSSSAEGTATPSAVAVR